jgi:cell division protein ZapD
MIMDTYIFEQPLNEIMRVCLRLEYLFKQLQYFVAKDTYWDIQAAVAAVIDILKVIDRPDLKAKLVNALQSHTSNLLQYHSREDIDTSKLESVLKLLEETQEQLYKTQGKLGENLRANEFLANIKQRLDVPAGLCEFAMPAYHLWLHQPVDVLQNEIKTWLADFSLLERINSLLLDITRNSGSPKAKVAVNGFYQEALSPNIPYQMLRIALPNKGIYPDISVGKHRVSIYFFYFLGSKKRATQITENIPFTFYCCR